MAMYVSLDAQIDGIEGLRNYESRYGYLLETDQVNPIQLQNALNLARKTGKSCESILLEDMHIDKEELEKSLSYFYDCPFVAFTTSIPIPVELLGKLKKSFLIQNSWVPLSSDIHIEPSLHSKKVLVRYRIDGVCQDVFRAHLSNARGMISRIKIMSHLDIAPRMVK